MLGIPIHVYRELFTDSDAKRRGEVMCGRVVDTKPPR